MSRIFDKFLYKLIVLLIIVGVVVGFRETIITDKAVAAAFGELMGAFPFAKQISDTICGIMGYAYGTASFVVSTSSVLTDILKLLIMALIQPLIMGLLTAIFLPLPSNPRNQILSTPRPQWEMQEEYMNSFGYKIKALLLSVAAAPFIALLSANILDQMTAWISRTFGTAGNAFGLVIMIIVAGVLSMLVLVSGGTTWKTAALWRLLVTVLQASAATIGTNVICLWIYLAVISGAHGQAATGVVTLFVWLLIMDLVAQLFKRAIVG